MTRPDDGDVLGDLLWLRKGAGATDTRLLGAGALVRVLGGDDQTPETLRARLAAAIGSLDDPRASGALQAAFGLGDEFSDGLTLGSRRESYGRAIGRSADALRDREDDALRALTTRLLTNYYAGAPLDRRLPVPHGGLLMSRLVVQTHYVDGYFAYQRQERVIIPLVDGAQGFRYDSTNEETRLADLDGVTVETRDLNGGSVHTLRFPSPIPQGRPYRFAFTEHAIRDKRGPLPAEDKAGQSFETPTLLYRQDVIFEGVTPTTIWWYQNLPLLERPGEPVVARLMPIDEYGTAGWTFSQLYGGLYSGIAWRWNGGANEWLARG